MHGSADDMNMIAEKRCTGKGGLSGSEQSRGIAPYRVLAAAAIMLLLTFSALLACQREVPGSGRDEPVDVGRASLSSGASTKEPGKDAISGNAQGGYEDVQSSGSAEESNVENGRGPSDDEWESPFEGLDRPISELEVVVPGVVRAPEGGMIWTTYLAVWFDGSYSDEHIREIIAQMGCEELTWHRSRALDRVMTQLKLSGGSDLEETARAFLALDEVERVFPEEFNPFGHAGAFAGG